MAGDVLNMKINTAYISQANMRDDFNKAEDIFVQVNLAQGADAAAVEARLKTVVENYPQFRFVSTREYLAEFSTQFDAMFAGVYVLLALLSVPSLIAILNTLAIGVIERTREIGMLRAIGAARGQVRRMVVAEALLLAAIGTAFGILGGLYFSYLMVAGLSASGVFKMAFSFPLASILAAIAAGLIFGVLAALYPARQAARWRSSRRCGTSRRPLSLSRMAGERKAPPIDAFASAFSRCAIPRKLISVTIMRPVRPQPQDLRHRHHEQHPAVRRVEVAAHRLFRGLQQPLQVEVVTHHHESGPVMVLLGLQQMAQ